MFHFKKDTIVCVTMEIINPMLQDKINSLYNII